MPFIRESIVTTLGADGTPHTAPLGVIEEGDRLVIAPFRPSRTLDNLERHPFACISYTSDVRVFAGCVTRRQPAWPTVPASRIQGFRLEQALAHSEVEVEDILADPQRPRFRCRQTHIEMHGPFLGFNRAQAAVVEASILVSRLHMLPPEKVESEIGYLAIAIAKTAGPIEREAWGWIMERIDSWRTASETGQEPG